MFDAITNKFKDILFYNITCLLQYLIIKFNISGYKI